MMKKNADSKSMKGCDGEVFGFMASKGRVTGDIVAPALTQREWGSLALPRERTKRKPKGRRR
jgi:hypothetical protein